MTAARPGPTSGDVDQVYDQVLGASLRVAKIQAALRRNLRQQRAGRLPPARRMEAIEILEGYLDSMEQIELWSRDLVRHTAIGDGPL